MCDVCVKCERSSSINDEIVEHVQRFFYNIICILYFTVMFVFIRRYCVKELLVNRFLSYAYYAYVFGALHIHTYINVANAPPSVKSYFQLKCNHHHSCAATTDVPFFVLPPFVSFVSNVTSSHRTSVSQIIFN